MIQLTYCHLFSVGRWSGDASANVDGRHKTDGSTVRSQLHWTLQWITVEAFCLFIHHLMYLSTATLS